MSSLINYYLNNVKSKEFSAFIAMAQNGYYPLFHSNWIAESFDQDIKHNVTLIDQKNTIQILDKLSQHSSIEKKYALIESLDKSERQILIKNFLKMVENRILDEQTNLQ